MSSSSRPKPSRKTSAHHRNTLSLNRTEIKIHVYDLLPPGKVSTVLWAIGSSLLHSGVVIGDKEYAYGGHDQPRMTGVYFTKPGQEPPGGTFRQAILHGFSFRPEEELKAIIHEASEHFQGTSYNLLTKNCNHFTSHLCEKLTGRPAPSWLNRAASIGVALPCVVPREWIAPPDHDTADGELLDDEDFEDERASMLRGYRDQQQRTTTTTNLRGGSGSNPHIPEAEEEEEEGGLGRGVGVRVKGFGAGERRFEDGNRGAGGGRPNRIVERRDERGREIPPAERAPLPRRLA